MLQLIFWILKSILILLIFYLLVPTFVNSITRNHWSKLPLFLFFALLASIFMAWLHYVPYILFFVWIVLTRYSLQAMTEDKFIKEASMAINKPLFYISLYLYVIIACFFAWLLQAEIVSKYDPTGKGVFLWKYILGLK